MAESITNSAKTVGTTAVKLHDGASKLVAVTIQNRGPAEVFLGASTVTAASGVGLASGATVTYTRDNGASALLAVNRFAISAAAGNDVRVEEVKA